MTHFTTTPTDIDYTHALASAAFASARDCGTALRVDVIPNLAPRERPAAQSVLEAIEARTIFDQKSLNALEGLIQTVSRKILDGTTKTEGFVADEHHIDGGATVTYRQRTEEADALARAMPVLVVLLEDIYALHDAMHAITAVEILRRRL